MAGDESNRKREDCVSHHRVSIRNPVVASVSFGPCDYDDRVVAKPSQMKKTNGNSLVDVYLCHLKHQCKTYGTASELEIVTVTNGNSITR